MNRPEAYVSLLKHLAPMNEAEIKAALFCVERIAAGREIYGGLDPHDGRNWVIEAAQEQVDQWVYASAWEQKREGASL